jgi:hypothetical protein
MNPGRTECEPGALTTRPQHSDLLYFTYLSGFHVSLLLIRSDEITIYLFSLS